MNKQSLKFSLRSNYRSIIVALIAFIVLAAGVYIYSTSQKGKSEPNVQHGLEQGHKVAVQGSRSYEIEVTSNTDSIKSQQPTKFSYKIKNDKGEILKNYEVAHEKIMHFIVIRKDLQNFQHLHPNFQQGSAEFSVDITFPNDGPYRVFPDFTPTEDNPQKLPVTVYHDIDVGNMSKYKPQPVTVDTQAKKTFGDYQIIYNLPRSIAKQQEISYSLTTERNGQPVTDLQTYLGALGHSVILKEGTLDFIHTHAGETGTGPKIEFSTSFPEAGIYKIFTQFQHEGEVKTVDYVVEVK